MTQIQIISTKRHASYLDLSYKMSFTLPLIYGKGQGQGINGLDIILASFPDGYSSETVPSSGTVITFAETIGLPLSLTLLEIKNKLTDKYKAIRTKLDSLTLTPYDAIAGLSYDGTNWT